VPPEKCGQGVPNDDFRIVGPKKIPGFNGVPAYGSFLYGPDTGGGGEMRLTYSEWRTLQQSVADDIVCRKVTPGEGEAMIFHLNKMLEDGSVTDIGGRHGSENV
jgi:hypothetical protein